MAIGILNRGTLIPHEIELRWSKGHVIMKSMAIVIFFLVEFDIYFLELEYVNSSHNK